MVATRLKCPRCASADMSLIETGSWSSSWTVRGGKFDRREGFHAPESVERLDARCAACDHSWKPRRAFQIDDVITTEGE
jgi:hypothetical protein